MDKKKTDVREWNKNVPCEEFAETLPVYFL